MVSGAVTMVAVRRRLFRLKGLLKIFGLGRVLKQGCETARLLGT